MVTHIWIWGEDRRGAPHKPAGPRHGGSATTCPSPRPEGAQVGSLGCQPIWLHTSGSGGRTGGGRHTSPRGPGTGALPLPARLPAPKGRRSVAWGANPYGYTHLDLGGGQEGGATQARGAQARGLCHYLPVSPPRRGAGR